MLDILALALSVAVASSHAQARDITAPVTFAYVSSPSAVRKVHASGMLLQLNAMRDAAGLTALNEDTALSQIALEHAQDMVSKHYFGHQTPQGPTLTDRFDRHHLHAQIVGENLAWCHDLHEASINLWQSAEHQTNERDPRFHHVGIAALRTGDQGTLYVQIFTE